MTIHADTRATSGRAVVYPESDGKPMGETDTHVREIAEYVLMTLSDHFADRPDVYVAANNFLYWVEGDPKRQVSPDGYVVFGVAKGPRRVFKVWEEGKTPSFVIEVSSRKTGLRDLGDKLAIYRDALRVPDYFLFDPLGEWIPEGIRGYRLVGDVYQELRADPETGRLTSAALGLEVAVVSGHVRFFVPGAAAPLPTPTERARTAEERAGAAEGRADAAEERVGAAEERAGAAQGRADAAEAEVARLRAELARLRGD